MENFSAKSGCKSSQEDEPQMAHFYTRNVLRHVMGQTLPPPPPPPPPPLVLLGTNQSVKI